MIDVLIPVFFLFDYLVAERKTADHISELIKETIVSFSLETQADSVTTDRGSDFVAAVEKLVDEGVVENHLSCACHMASRTMKLGIHREVNSLFCWCWSGVESERDRESQTGLVNAGNGKKTNNGSN